MVLSSWPSRPGAAPPKAKGSLQWGLGGPAWQIYMDDGLGGAVALRDTVADTMGPRSLLATRPVTDVTEEAQGASC